MLLLYKNGKSIYSQVKIINLLDSNDNESQKFATKRWYIINDQNTSNNAYGNGEDSTTIKFETKVSNLICVIILMHTF